MVGTESNPGRQVDRQPGELQGKQANDACEKTERDQERRAPAEKENPGRHWRDERQRVDDVVAELFGLDQEQLGNSVQRPPELSHVQHCS